MKKYISVVLNPEAAVKNGLNIILYPVIGLRKFRERL